MNLGRLKLINLRDFWRHEAFDFTRWLAEPQNLELLSDEVGIGIKNATVEAQVGRFKVDILADEENTDKKVIIENQLEATDHGHLGQLITYAAGLEAKFIIWIVQDCKEEHRRAVDWLNEHTDEHISFFLVKIELWQIEDSLPAAKFAVVSRPNEWQRSVHADIQDSDLTATKTKQLEFWQQLKELAAISSPDLKLRTPRPQHWFDIAIGRSDCFISLVLDSRKDTVGCQLYIPDSKDLFLLLLSNKEQIEMELAVAEPIIWQELPGKKASRIGTLHRFHFSDVSTWDSAIEWLTNTASKFKKVFSEIIRQHYSRETSD